MAVPGREDTHFVRWLELFYGTLKDLGPSLKGAALVAPREHTIADSLLAISIRRDGISGSKQEGISPMFER
ncbi:MAG: hypothetical protein IPF48_14115 [Sphingomonadales bacterium]|nr:hypothetical protein [Sphingomonadales bacterium]